MNGSWRVQVVPPPDQAAPGLVAQRAEPGGILQWWYQQTGSFSFLQQWVMPGSGSPDSSLNVSEGENSSVQRYLEHSFEYPLNHSFQHSCLREGFLLAEVADSLESCDTSGESEGAPRVKIMELLILQTPRRPGDLWLWRFPHADRLWFWRHGYNAWSVQTWLQKVRGIADARIVYGHQSQRLRSLPASGVERSLGSLTLGGKALLQIPRLVVYSSSGSSANTNRMPTRLQWFHWSFRPRPSAYNRRLGVLSKKMMQRGSVDRLGCPFLEHSTEGQ